MRIATVTTTDTLEVGRYQDRITLYFGETGGSASLTFAEAARLRDDLTRKLPVAGGETSLALVHALLRERAAESVWEKAQGPYDRQHAHGVLLTRCAETDRIAAMVLAAHQPKQAAA